MGFGDILACVAPNSCACRQPGESSDAVRVLTGTLALPVPSLNLFPPTSKFDPQRDMLDLTGKVGV